MANKKISELDAVTEPLDEMEVPVNDAGTTKKITRKNLFKNAEGNSHPFNFPIAGNIKTISPFEMGGNSFSGTLIDVEGAGVIRQIFIATFGLSETLQATWAAQGTFRIYYDGSETADFEVPIKNLLNQNLVDASPGSIYENRIYAVKGNHTDGTSNYCGWYLFCEIPFTDGIKITLESATYSNVVYQDELPDCWNRNLRLKSASISQTLNGAADAVASIASQVGSVLTSADGDFSTVNVGDYIKVGFNVRKVTGKADSTHITLEYPIYEEVSAQYVQITNQIQFLNLAAGKAGYIMASITTMSPSDASWIYLEANPHFHLNGEVVPSYEYPGTEDYFGCPFYATAGTIRNLDQGVSYRDDTDKDIGFYRIHYIDPIKYTNGITGHWGASFTLSETPANVVTQWVTLYYEDMT